MLRRLGRELLRLEGFRFADVVADLDLGRDVARDLRAQAERFILGEELRPDLGEPWVIREVVLPPVLDGSVIAVGQHADLVAHDV